MIDSIVEYYYSQVTPVSKIQLVAIHSLISMLDVDIGYMLHGALSDGEFMDVIYAGAMDKIQFPIENYLTYGQAIKLIRYMNKLYKDAR